MSEISTINSGLNLEQSSGYNSSLSFMPISRATVQNPYVRCIDSVAYMKKIFGIVLVIAIFVAICLCSFYPFSQMTDSLALKIILSLTLWIGNVIGVLIVLIGIVILICSKFFL